MIAVRLPKKLEAQLEKIASETHRSKSYYVRKALEQFLEDREDYLLAIARLEENNPRIPYAPVWPYMAKVQLARTAEKRLNIRV